jgi:hypothetical protein
MQSSSDPAVTSAATAKRAATAARWRRQGDVSARHPFKEAASPHQHARVAAARCTPLRHAAARSACKEACTRRGGTARSGAARALVRRNVFQRRINPHAVQTATALSSERRN